MNKNFSARFALFLQRKIRTSFLDKLINISNICVNEHDIRSGKYILLSSSNELNKYIYLKNDVFSKQGAETIKKTNGYYMQPSLNPNAQIGERILGTKNLFIKTELTQTTFIEIVIASEKIINTSEQKALATILFKDILKVYYSETKNIKKYEMQCFDTYAKRHEKDFQEEFALNIKKINDVNFSWQLDKENHLNTKHLQLILGLMLQYDNEEIKKYFGISKESKKQHFDRMKKIFKLEQKAKKSEIMKKARNLNIVRTLEQALNI